MGVLFGWRRECFGGVLFPLEKEKLLQKGSAFGEKEISGARG